MFQFTTYFENSFGRIYNNYFLTKHPYFEISRWNAHWRVLNDIQRTANMVEALHRSINNKIVSAHPNFS